ncbi:hypothetical protein BDP55DRAFT_664932 [Colletotrichum godetiae]|uniref:Uncharacterized protein n=1 Tax=Colletotrichum godetiae TaxID=1209918 RepID=A0AAJ0EVE1_9PEZI|nr:uncharacterized protein BDP55DRAFT_664932 [Colletotrichum godetiae]KAK1675233.1 hypothetical protein BDP55DRAFT_664932 [Colletotrichum godetiae]
MYSVPSRFSTVYPRGSYPARLSLSAERWMPCPSVCTSVEPPELTHPRQGRLGTDTIPQDKGREYHH